MVVFRIAFSGGIASRPWKLGRSRREVLHWIRSEDTESKIRFDLGRILVLALVDANLSCEVTVNKGNQIFPVKLVEHHVPVTDRWVNKVLGLRPGVSNLNQISNWGVFDPVSVGKQRLFGDDGHGVREKVGGTKKVMSTNRGLQESRQGVGKRVPEALRQPGSKGMDKWGMQIRVKVGGLNVRSLFLGVSLEMEV
ncbi:hypothetical protein Q3G72_032959 [Acer saccharum]|nr:hypothetical protein Q3G72_032959 [Acer saccharum]